MKVIHDLNSRLSLHWLEHLDLSEAPGVNDTVVSDICLCCGPNLRSLILDWCWEFTDTAVDHIVSVCSALRQLSLVGNSVIQGNAFAEVPDKMPHLVILNLYQCNHVQDTILEELAAIMPALYVFNFFGERVGGDVDDLCQFGLSRARSKVPICTH